MTQKAYLLYGDALELLQKAPDSAFDGCLSDPPYGLSFMGRSWDRGVPSAAVWAQVLRAIRPGAHAMIFGGSRTFHRLGSAVEDAGFEIRDCLSWIYGTGMPKGLDLSRAVEERSGIRRPRDRKPNVPRSAILGNRPWMSDDSHRMPSREPASDIGRLWDGWDTALKPAWEPCILAMRPTEGSFAENALKHGVAGLSIDPQRIGLTGGTRKAGPPSMRPGVARTGSASGVLNGGGCEPIGKGRYPANVVLDEAVAAELDAELGERGGGYGWSGGTPEGRGVYRGGFPRGDNRTVGFGDSGGPSRFMYTAKAGQNERHAGCDGLFWRRDGDRVVRIGKEEFASLPPSARLEGNAHPTVKPLSLCRWLAGLLLPPPRQDGRPRSLLIPYSGSGSEMIGALQAGWECVVGIENDPNHVEIAAARIKHAGVDPEIEL